jgi:hypothetical protein
MPSQGSLNMFRWVLRGARPIMTREQVSFPRNPMESLLALAIESIRAIVNLTRRALVITRLKQRTSTFTQ